MNKAAICFTEDGMALVNKINDSARKVGIDTFTAYVKRAGDQDMAGFINVTEDLGEWTKRRFAEHDAILFVGAAGIAVRAISGAINDKLSDSPVLVCDDMGNYVIPLLSGHVGGADKMAVTIAELIGAVPVITTSTDVHGALSADVLAGEYGLKIRNREGIKKVSAKAIEGKAITLSIKDYPPDEPVDIIIADDTDREYSLLMPPKKYVLGIGTKKGKDPDDAERFISETLASEGIGNDDIYAVCTIDIKENEETIKRFCNRHVIPLLTFEARLLDKAKGDFTPSEFVKKTTGVDNVCERAAVLGAGPGAELIVKKKCGEGITLAVAKRRS